MILTSGVSTPKLTSNPYLTQWQKMILPTAVTASMFFFLAIKLVLDLDFAQLLVCRDQEIVSITLIIYLLYHRELI